MNESHRLKIYYVSKKIYTIFIHLLILNNHYHYLKILNKRRIINNIKSNNNFKYFINKNVNRIHLSIISKI